MMFKWSGIYVNPQDVTAIYTARDGSGPHPFYMVVHLRDGKEYRLNYSSERNRDADASQLANMVSKMQPVPVTYDEIESLLDKVKSAIRRDVKALRAELTSAEKEEE